MSGRHMQVDKEAVTSRHVTSGRHRRRRGQGGRHVTSRHVTSRQDVTGAAVDKEAVTSRHVTSRQDISGARHVTSGHHRRRRGQGCRNVASRHVTSRHVTSRRQAPPERTMLVLRELGDMGDQEIAFDNADWSEDSNMGECDPGAPLTDQASSAISDYDMLTVGRSARDLLRKKIAP